MDLILRLLAIQIFALLSELKNFSRQLISAYLFILFSILVLGGIPWNGKQYFVYAQDLTRIGVGLVFVWMLLLKNSWDEIPFLKSAKEVFSLIVYKKQIPSLRVSHFSILTGLVWLSFCFFLAPVFRHWFFETRAFDVGIYENVIYNGSKFGSLFTHTFELTPGQPLKFFPNNHLDWSLWIYSGIYSIFPHVELLLISQSLGFFLCLIPFTRLAKRHLEGENKVLLAVLCFICFDSIHRNNLWEYHSVSWIFFFSLSSLCAFDEGKTKKGYVFGLLATLFRADAWWVFGGIIFYQGLRSKKYFRGSLLALIALSILPIHSAIYNQVNLFDQRYGYLGHTLGEAARFAISHPGRVLQAVFDTSHLNFLFELFLRTGGFPNLLSGAALVTGFLPFAQVFFSDSHSFLDWTLHYVGLFFGPLFFTLVLGWKRLSTTLFIVSVSLMVSQLALLETSEVQRIFRDYSQKACFRELVQQIPTDAKLIARDPFFAQLSRRKWISVPAREAKQDIAEWFITPLRTDLDEFGQRSHGKSWEIVSERCGVFLAKRPEIR